MAVGHKIREKNETAGITKKSKKKRKKEEEKRNVVRMDYKSMGRAELFEIQMRAKNGCGEVREIIVTRKKSFEMTISEMEVIRGYRQWLKKSKDPCGEKPKPTSHPHHHEVDGMITWMPKSFRIINLSYQGRKNWAQKMLIHDNTDNEETEDTDFK